MTLLDLKIGIATPKLEVPHELKPTLPNRGWLVHPFNNNPFYSVFLAIPPALLGTILIFMDQQITSVIVNRREYKLKKGEYDQNSTRMKNIHQSKNNKLIKLKIQKHTNIKNLTIEQIVQGQKRRGISEGYRSISACTHYAIPKK